MPTHPGTNPRNHVKHYSCSSLLENFTFVQILLIIICKKCPLHLGSFIKHHGLFVPYIVHIFDCEKCHTHLVSFIKHHGLFVPYIVDIFDCEKYNIHLVSFIKNHGLFVPYIDDIFIFLIRRSWLSPSYIHPFQEF